MLDRLSTLGFDSARLSRLLRESGWILLGQILVIIGSLAGVRLMTELLTPKSYGELALGMTGALLVNQMAFGPLSKGAGRFYSPASESHEMGSYLEATRHLVLQATGLVSGVAVIAIAASLMLGHRTWAAIGTATVIFALFSGYSAVIRESENAARRRKTVALHEGAETWLRFLAGALFILWFGPTSTAAMAGYAAAIILIFVSQYIFFKRSLNTVAPDQHNLKRWHEMLLHFSWPFSVWGMFYWAQRASDRWALGAFAGVDDVGIYAVLFQLGFYPMSLLTSMGMRLLSPVIFKRAGDGGDTHRLNNVRVLCLRLTISAVFLTIVAFLISLLAHELIFKIFAAEEYRLRSFLLPWMILSGGFFAAGETISLMLMSELKTRSMMSVKISVAVLAVIANLIGAYLYQTVGVVFATVLAALIYVFWMIAVSITSRSPPASTVCV